MGKQKIILDSDPGHDDAIAIMLAGRSPAVDLLGISVIAGNQTIEKTTINALNVCQYLDLPTKVYQGCSQPIVRRVFQNAADIHGKTGLDGPAFGSLTRKKESEHSVNFIIDMLMASDGDIILVPTGPMTNIAMAMRMEPRIISKIKRIVFMGGSYQNGNVTPAAEFNIISDAEAAYIVCTSGVPLTMVGLDVTRKVLCLPSVVERMSKLNTKAARLFTDLMTFFNKTQKEVFGWEGGPLHDPVTVASIIDPMLLITKHVHIEIDISGGPSQGRTNCDLFNYKKQEPNCDVAVDINVTKFWDIIEQGILNYK
jgi:ribosylpyrimidine nucleosidase